MKNLKSILITLEKKYSNNKITRGIVRNVISKHESKNYLVKLI